jgi:hypothetical protein
VSGKDEDPDAFMRSITFPVEDRHLLTSAPWPEGGFRWFRSPNVVDLVARRRQQQRPPDPPRWRSPGKR